MRNLLLATCLVLAQTTSGTVVAVTIDAAVVDAQRRPVTGLSAGDFAVELDGQSQRVVAATYLPSGAPMAGAIGPAFDAATPAPPVYRLVVQPPDGTPAGREFAIALSVKRPGTKVETPPRIAAAPVTVTGTRAATGPSATVPAEERVRTAMATGRRETGLPIVAGHTIRRAADPGLLTLEMQFEVAGPATPPLKPAVGLVVERGPLRSAAPRIEPAGEGRYRVDLSVSVPAGLHKVRFAVADAAGAIGAIEYPVNAQPRQIGPIRTSDLLRWTGTANERKPLHLSEVASDVATIGAGLELYDTTGSIPPPDLIVKFELIGRDRNAPPVIERLVTPEVRDAMLVAEAEFPLGRLGSGEYELRATIMSGPTVLGSTATPLVKR